LGELVDELLSTIEDDVQWFNDAARHYEKLAASKLDRLEKSQWNLLATVFRERARHHEDLAKKMRTDEQLTGLGGPSRANSDRSSAEA
jgi:hypothetical protein